MQTSDGDDQEDPAITTIATSASETSSVNKDVRSLLMMWISDLQTEDESWGVKCVLLRSIPSMVKTELIFRSFEPSQALDPKDLCEILFPMCLTVSTQLALTSSPANVEYAQEVFQCMDSLLEVLGNEFLDCFMKVLPSMFVRSANDETCYRALKAIILKHGRLLSLDSVFAEFLNHQNPRLRKHCAEMLRYLVDSSQGHPKLRRSHKVWAEVLDKVKGNADAETPATSKSNENGRATIDDVVHVTNDHGHDKKQENGVAPKKHDDVGLEVDRSATNACGKFARTIVALLLVVASMMLVRHLSQISQTESMQIPELVADVESVIPVQREIVESVTVNEADIVEDVVEDDVEDCDEYEEEVAVETEEESPPSGATEFVEEEIGQGSPQEPDEPTEKEEPIIEEDGVILPGVMTDDESRHSYSLYFQMLIAVAVFYFMQRKKQADIITYQEIRMLLSIAKEFVY